MCESPKYKILHLSCLSLIASVNSYCQYWRLYDYLQFTVTILKSRFHCNSFYILCFFPLTRPAMTRKPQLLFFLLAAGLVGKHFDKPIWMSAPSLFSVDSSIVLCHIVSLLEIPRPVINTISILTCLYKTCMKVSLAKEIHFTNDLWLHFEQISKTS